MRIKSGVLTMRPAGGGGLPRRGWLIMLTILGTTVVHVVCSDVPALTVYWWENGPYMHRESNTREKASAVEANTGSRVETANGETFAGIFASALDDVRHRCVESLVQGPPRRRTPNDGEVGDKEAGLFRYTQVSNQLELLSHLSRPGAGTGTTFYLPVTSRLDSCLPPVMPQARGEEEEEEGWFVPLVESPGAVHFFRKELEPAASDLSDVIRQAWPLIIMILLGAAYSGIIIWLLDRLWNPTNFPKPFIRGFWEGFWWAFVTMTTVGYGDTTPRSIQARVFGLVWIVVGITILSVFTATVTTVLTQSSLVAHNSLHDISVAVLNGSEEYGLAISLGAKAIVMNDFDQLVASMTNKRTQAALVDQFVFAVNQAKLQDNFILDQVYPHKVLHGIYIRGSPPRFRSCMTSYLRENRLRHVIQLANYVPPITAPTVTAMNGGQDLFQPETILYLFYGLAVWVIIFVAFVIWQFAYWTPKHRARKELKRKLVAGQSTEQGETGQAVGAAQPSSNITLFTRPKSALTLLQDKARQPPGGADCHSQEAESTHRPKQTTSRGRNPPIKGVSALASFVNAGFDWARDNESSPCKQSTGTERSPPVSVSAGKSDPGSSSPVGLRGLIDRQFSELKTLEEDFHSFRREWERKVLLTKARHRTQQQEAVKCRHQWRTGDAELALGVTMSDSCGAVGGGLPIGGTLA